MTAINSNRAIRGPVTAVPVVAGKGVRLTADTENNRWIVEADETVLYEDSTGVAATGETAALSESIANFEKVAFYSEPIYGGALIRNEFDVSDLPYRFSTGSLDGNNVFIAQYNVTISTTTVTVSRSRRVTTTYAGAVTTTDLSATGSYKAPIRKIVGINRVASA